MYQAGVLLFRSLLFHHLLYLDNFVCIKLDLNPPFFPGDTFTFSDITRKVLLYRHAGLSTQDDAMSFSVSDGISMATTVVQVTVLSGVSEESDGPRRDPAATLSLEVGEKSSTVIRRSHIAYTVSEKECMLGKRSG